MSSHTPGPWHVNRYGLVTAASGVLAKPAVRPMPQPEREANLRLIAAAPEMYDTLCALRDGLYASHLRESDAWTERVADALNRMDDVLARLDQP